MKIPQVLAQESVALARTPRIGSSFNGQGEAALGQGLANVGHALGQIAQAEQAKRNQFGRDEAAHATAAVELDLKTFAADLDVTERDPDRYEQAMQRRVQETTDRAAAALTSEEGRAVFQQKMGLALVDLLVGARRRANTLYVERGTAMLDDTTANTLALIGATRFGDDETFLRQTRNGSDAIMGATPYLGSVETGKRRRAFQSEALETYANTAIEAGQFNPADSRWVGMDPARFEILRRRAQTEETRRAKEYDTALEKAMTLQSQEVEKTVLDAIEARDFAKASAILDVDGRRLMKPERYEHWRKRVAEPPVEKDDPDVVRRLLPEVYRVFKEPADNLRHVRALTTALDSVARRLSPSTEKEYRAHLASRAETAQNKELAQVGRDHSDVQSLIREGIPSTGAFGATVVMAAQIREQALRELNRQSAYSGGSEAPMEWWDRRKSYYLARSVEAGQTRMMEMRRALGPYTTAGAIAAARPQIGEERYFELINLWQQIKQLDLELVQMRGKPPESKPAAAGTPSGPAGPNPLQRTPR